MEKRFSTVKMFDTRWNTIDPGAKKDIKWLWGWLNSELYFEDFYIGSIVSIRGAHPHLQNLLAWLRECDVEETEMFIIRNKQ